jgi:hypothetical protein
VSRASEQSHPSGLRHRLHEILFEADTPAEKLFDVVLLCASRQKLSKSYGTAL